MKRFLLFTLAILLFSCELLIDRLEYGNSTKSVLESYKNEYAFDKFQIFKHEGKFQNFVDLYFHNYYESKSQLPLDSIERGVVLHTISQDVFNSLPASEREQIDEVTICVTERKTNRLIYNRATTETCFFRVNDDDSLELKSRSKSGLISVF